MILCIDSGNTRLKWGIHDGEAWCAHGVLAQNELLRLGPSLPRELKLEAAIISNVAGSNVADVLRVVLPVAPDRVRFVQSEAVAGGVRNTYRVPVQLGVDRWCALIGARHLTAHACVVVGAGTATTIDTLNATGDFLGGLIVPGFELMRHSLASNTAQLPYTDGEWQAYPQRTQDAIFTGCLEAQLGGIERAFARISGEPGAQCLVHGGAAPKIVAHLNCPHRVEEHLVLAGLLQLSHDS